MRVQDSRRSLRRVAVQAVRRLRTRLSVRSARRCCRCCSWALSQGPATSFRAKSRTRAVLPCLPRAAALLPGAGDIHTLSCTSSVATPLKGCLISQFVGRVRLAAASAKPKVAAPSQLDQHRTSAASGSSILNRQPVRRILRVDLLSNYGNLVLECIIIPVVPGCSAQVRPRVLVSMPWPYLPSGRDRHCPPRRSPVGFWCLRLISQRSWLCLSGRVWLLELVARPEVTAWPGRPTG